MKPGGMRTLEDHHGDKQNNFTLLRLLMAALVLVGHAYPITANGNDPISDLLIPYAWIGSIAVAGFFVISGLLVTSSFQNRGATFFAASRVLRLYPALFVYGIVSILVIGPLAIQVPLADYFRANPWDNMQNTLLWTWEKNLPYAFAANPFSGSTNGSAWTLPVELRCYLLVLLLGFFGLLDKRSRANIVLLAVLYQSYQPFDGWPLFGESERFIEPLRFFLVGALCWVNRQWIVLSWIGALVSLVVLVLSAKFDYRYVEIYPVALTYIVLVLAFKTPPVDIDRFGDISYGVYLYAWPIQQLVWQPGQSAEMNILLSLPIVVVIAYLSWRLVEKPAMGLRRYLPRANARLATAGSEPAAPALAPSNIRMRWPSRRMVLAAASLVLAVAAAGGLYAYAIRTPSQMATSDQQTADRLTPERYRANVDARFDDFVRLAGANIHCDAAGARIELVWQKLADRDGVHTTAVHLVDGEGKILAQADYLLPAGVAGLDDGSFWRDEVLVPPASVGEQTVAVAIGVYDDAGYVLQTPHPVTDWDGRRLILPLGDCRAAGN